MVVKKDWHQSRNKWKVRSQNIRLAIDRNTDPVKKKKMITTKSKFTSKLSNSDQDFTRAQLKGMTTRGSGRKPSMPKLPWDKNETSSD